MEPRLIRRYSNRKLYDTSNSRYVTLAELAVFIRSGGSLRVEQHGTKTDLTSATLAQIIFEEERSAARMPVEALRRIIRTGMIPE